MEGEKNQFFQFFRMVELFGPNVRYFGFYVKFPIRILIEVNFDIFRARKNTGNLNFENFIILKLRFFFELLHRLLTRNYRNFILI